MNKWEHIDQLHKLYLFCYNHYVYKLYHIKQIMENKDNKLNEKNMKFEENKRSEKKGKDNMKKNTDMGENLKTDKIKDDKKDKKKFFTTKADKIKKLEKEIEDLKGDYLRSRADFENYRRRKEKDILTIRDRAVTNFVLDLLPSIDNFEMSLKMKKDKDMFIKGVEMIHSNLKKVLSENKFKEFSCKVGEEFDPNLHDPVLIESDEFKAGQVVAVLRKGYKHNEKVVRPVRVHVAKEVEDNEKNSNEENSQTQE